MNLVLNHEGFEKNLITHRECNGGMQYLFRFENHYGASVVKHSFSYGSGKDLWELAVIKFDPENGSWYLTYTTPITEDVEGCLTDEEVRDLLQRIKEL